MSLKRILLLYGVLAEPVREEVGQVADFFRRFSAGGPNKRKRVNGNREIGKNLAQRSRLEIPFNAVGWQDGYAQSL